MTDNYHTLYTEARQVTKLQLDKFRDTGVDLPIIQFNPIGDTMESFSLLKKTLFSKWKYKSHNNNIF